MKKGYIKQKDRKKILLLTDDIRVHSGVAQIGRETVINTSHRYNWCQMAGAVKHPDKGQHICLGEEMNKHAEIKDAYCKLYPVDGYGNPDLLNAIIKREKPDALFLITDPRYFEWVFRLENHIRRDIPIIYLNIWDNYPAPMYNKEFYESCDALFGISKQTVNINKLVLGNKIKNKLFKYVPHGLNNNMFKPLNNDHPQVLDFKRQLFRDKEQDFSMLFNSRNIRRKNISDLLMAWRLFTEKLTPEEAKKCTLVLHTEAIFDHGTDLPAVIDYFDPHDGTYNIALSSAKLSTEQMNLLYNSVDGVAQTSNAEGWGLALTEAMLTGTPFIATVTGGMQDQMRFEDENGDWIQFDENIPSNHRKTYTKHGEWAFPVFPKCQSIVGSPLTPYIYDDHHDCRDTADQIYKLYKLSPEKRKEVGMKGFKWATSSEAGFTSEQMSKRIIEGVDQLFNSWEPRENFEFLKDTDYEPRVLPHKLIY